MSDNAFSLAKFYCLRYLLGDSALAEADMVPGVMEAIQDHLTARGIQESLSAFVEALVEVSGIESTGAAQQRGLRLLDAGSIPGQPLFVRPLLLKALRELSHYQQALLIIYGLKAHGPKERGELIAYIDAVCADWALPTDKFNILYLEV